MAASVYILCAITSIGCAALLLKSSRKTPSRLLFWSGSAFACLALGNVLLVVDLLIVPQYDLLLARHLITFFAVVMLLYGLIWETE